jgi:hypothetical protein
VYPCSKKSLGMQLSNIVINWKNYILEDSYLPHRDDVLLTLHQVSSPRDAATFHHFGHPDFGGTDGMWKWRKNAAVGHNSHDSPPYRPKTNCNKS